jgi:capsular exopolysaccharide synthesis family protein
LRILSAVQSPNVELIQPAQVPELPASPRPKRNAVLGVLFGLLLGVGLAAVRQQVDQRLRELKDLESVARRPLLGTIPRHPALARATPPADLPHEVMDPFRSLELALRYRIGVQQTSCVMVTSVAAGEGKSVCAWHLAMAMAAAGKRTIYIDSDLRRPGAAKRFSIGQTMDLLHNQLAIGPGLADVLVGSAVRGEAVVRVPVSRVEERAVELDVLTAGEATRSPSDLLDSPAMRELLDECAAEYDMIVIDAPAASNRVEAVALGRVVSGVVIVVSIGTTLRGDFERLQDDLEQMGTPVYGIVANGVRRPYVSGGR